MSTTNVEMPASNPLSRRIPSRRALTIASLGMALAAISLGTWRTVDWAASGSAASASTPTFRTWLRPIDVVGVQRQLVRAGYSIPVTGVLDPITKSALADFLRPSSSDRLGPSLAYALRGTVITTRREPAAWNMRFGLNRRTRFVERPLTGPGGQLDAYGNVRSQR